MANQGEIFFYYLPPPDSRIGNPLLKGQCHEMVSLSDNFKHLLKRKCVCTEDIYRREGKGSRYCLADRIDSIPCRASYFALGRFEE